MILEITNEPFEIDFAPPDERLEIVQNVRTILTTMKKSVPLFREIGISADSLDMPLNELTQTKIAAELATQISKYESRAVLKKVECSGDLSGDLKITATIEI